MGAVKTLLERCCWQKGRCVRVHVLDTGVEVRERERLKREGRVRLGW